MELNSGALKPSLSKQDKKKRPTDPRMQNMMTKTMMTETVSLAPPITMDIGYAEVYWAMQILIREKIEINIKVDSKELNKISKQWANKK